MNLVPDTGFEGQAAIQEAAASEYRAVMGLLRDALTVAVYPGGTGDHYLAIDAIYPDRAVVKKDERLWSYPYAINADNQVELGPAEEVIVDHKPVAMRESLDTRPGEGDDSHDKSTDVIIEAVQPAEKGGIGLKYLVRIIRAGLSGNRNYYSDGALREAAPLFNGARVFAKSDEEHLQRRGKDFNKLIGRITEARFVAGQSADSGDLRGTLELLESAAPVPQKIYEAYQRGMANDLFGFSIDAEAHIKRRILNGTPVREAVKFLKVNSLDLIIDPGAGGEIVKLIESIDTDSEDRDMTLQARMIEAIKQVHHGQLPDGLNVDDETALEAAFREAILADSQTRQTEGAESVTEAQMQTAIRLVEARATMRASLAAAPLPAQARSRLQAEFERREDFTIDQVREAIEAEKGYIQSLHGGGQVTGLGDSSVIEAGEDWADKVTKMLDAFFDPSQRDVISIKECYVNITGDKRVSGRLDECNKTRLAEAVGAFRESLDSGSWANVLGNSITRRMLADYGQTLRYDVWRSLCSVVPVNDFRNQERTRIGGYGDLPIVSEGEAYGALASPSDEKAEYSAAKRGGTEDVTLEMIKNDDVGSVMRIPMRLSRAAKRTLSKFVLDFLKDNPTIYDSKALFHADRGNLGSAALSTATLAASRLRVLKQTELSSADRIGIPPVNLWVPFDLEETAFNLFRRDTNNDPDFVESLRMNVLPVWYWTDANNWYTTCDPDEVPTIEVGFLDGNEEPSLFVQDNPTVGSLFSNDKITYKIRHIYGGNVMDFRGMDGNVVA